MQITGDILVGNRWIAGEQRSFYAVDPATNQTLEPTFAFAGASDVERACTLAWQAFGHFRATPPDVRARFLETIAEQILRIGDALIVRAMSETGLPRDRLEGERARTIGQLGLFAGVLRDGEYLGLRIDTARPDRTPLPRADFRLRNIPLGPVAVFGASNFPLAFSVAGGDTVSALAAGCPVVVKGHPAHPGTGELVARAVQAAVVACGLPEGTFSYLLGGVETGTVLVRDPHIKAVGFTGSRSGGLALVRLANARPEPIPVYAEMSSSNPVYLLPAALTARAEAIGREFIDSLTTGAGQFCTNPGLVFALKGPDLDRFLEAAASRLREHQAAPMLTPGIHQAYAAGVRALSEHDRVETIASGCAGGVNRGTGVLFSTTAQDFMADERLGQEVFGPSSLVVRCGSVDELLTLTEKLEGQLTATLQIDRGDFDLARRLLPLLERRVGRILANSWPTGVEVCHAMVHGGPFPATSDSRATSVGSLAIARFLRPVCYQNLPEELVADELKDESTMTTIVDGARRG